MKSKEGRDFLNLEDCIAAVEPSGSVRLSTMSESIEISKAEWAKLVAFVEKKNKTPANPR